jgi:hypothetical protein
VYIACEMPYLNVYFYKPAENDRFWNHVVVNFDGPFSHCDVQFDDNRMASSIYMGESVYFRKRKFSNPNYQPPIVLYVSPAGYKEAADLCSTRSKEQYQFDMIDQLLSPFGISIGRQKYTYCSRHCAEVLKAAGVSCLKDVDTSCISPSQLYRLIRNQRVIHSNSLRMVSRD